MFSKGLPTNTSSGTCFPKISQNVLTIYIPFKLGGEEGVLEGGRAGYKCGLQIVPHMSCHLDQLSHPKSSLHLPYLTHHRRPPLLPPLFQIHHCRRVQTLLNQRLTDHRVKMNIWACPKWIFRKSHWMQSLSFVCFTFVWAVRLSMEYQITWFPVDSPMLNSGMWEKLVVRIEQRRGESCMPTCSELLKTLSMNEILQNRGISWI